jgi:hypothetical protein
LRQSASLGVVDTRPHGAALAGQPDYRSQYLAPLREHGLGSGIARAELQRPPQRPPQSVWRRGGCTACARIRHDAWRDSSHVTWQARTPLAASQGHLVSFQIGPDSAQAIDVMLRWAVVAHEVLGQPQGGGASMLRARRVLASRARHGGGAVSATVVLDVFNHAPRDSIAVLVLDRLPWYARLLAHTMRIQSRGKDGHVKSDSLRQVEDATMRLATLMPRRGMTVLEYRLQVPPNSSVRVEFEMHKAFLHLDDFPPGKHGTRPAPAPASLRLALPCLALPCRAVPCLALPCLALLDPVSVPRPQRTMRLIESIPCSCPMQTPIADSTCPRRA